MMLWILPYSRYFSMHSPLNRIAAMKPNGSCWKLVELLSRTVRGLTDIGPVQRPAFDALAASGDRLRSNAIGQRRDGHVFLQLHRAGVGK